MKTVAPEQLTKAYETLFPEEFKGNNAFEQVQNIMSNWLEGYKEEPERKISVSNFSGKVTKALFLALEIKKPRTKKEMLRVLEVI